MINETRAEIEVTTAKAERKLADVRQQVEEARDALRVWRRALLESQQAADADQAAQLIEANEQLILAALAARTEVDATSRALDELTRSAGIDDLTGLPNRTLLLDQLPSMIASTKRHGVRMAVMFLDLDHFKPINDTLGHAVGDEVLKLVANRITPLVRDDDVICRYGGDEFVILLAELAKGSDAALVAGKMLAALSAPCNVAGHAFDLSACIGISVCPDDSDDPETLIAYADAAMSLAKHQQDGGSHYVFHDESSPGSAQSQSAVPTPPSLSSIHNAQLREANSALILAALDAQALQAAAERLLLQQKEALAVVAHELRTPLTPIRLATDMLGRVRPAEMRRYQDIIENEIEHMVAVINDLLDVSRVETGKLRINCQIVDLGRLVTAAVDACRSEMDRRKQHLIVEMPVQAIKLDADPIRLAQVLRNLLDNASKYTPPGGDLEISVAVVSENAVIRISDTGIGISAEALDRVFEPFTQEDRAIRFNGVGLGLGLAVVRELVTAHGGSVVATSGGPGLGSQFVVTLPLAGTDPGSALKP